ncbi:ATP-dependent exoDNAse (exonuclease V) beta subunit [Arthrobacter sp. 1088]|uniref:UvrD-helicase domain-containing protein n=1 Tax=Arthrobacter sp. 1088 TaxID=2817768 RepID=UPI0028580D96|nr:UvrD-helicase domain-containing protein [Arthrobacter sp. 1088]MDR6685753.1 ATP-dependent exoDNAse (exonuclease V) beta subunit [Arthrobacter sp. 1088]
MTTLDNVTMVSASAGTGKTYHLTSEITDRIQSGLTATQIMATTFTKKAAGELQERISARLLEQAGAADGSHARSLQLAAQQLPASLIGTVNSVCGQLLQEYAIDAGLSPALEVIPEEQLRGIFHLAVDSVLANHAAGILPIARRMGTDEDSPYNSQTWQDTVRSIVDAARTNLLRSSDLAACADRSWAGIRELLDDPAEDERPVWLSDMRAGRAELEELAKTGLDAAGRQAKTTTGVFVEQYPKVIQKIDSATTPDETPWEIWRGFVASKPAAPIAQIFRDLRTRIYEGLLSNPAFHSDIEQYIRRIFACAAECLETYADFKRLHGLMDFVDQETLVLDLARTSDVFRSSLSQRIRFLVVDEFQDTSPLQLELFLQLSGLVKEAVWVGDPKQAIYEFRGTDPDLMQTVVNQVKNKRQLSESWRSCSSVIALSNAVFEPVFGTIGMPAASVRLDMPEAHKDWPKGSLEAWVRPQKNDGDRLLATAAGVGDLLNRRSHVKPGDIAVLTRSNEDVDAISAALDGLGIRATRNPRKLNEAREVQLARAAMAYVADDQDTIALTELVALHPGHPSNGTWQRELLSAVEPKTVHTSWAQQPQVRALTPVRDLASTATPLEIFEAVIGAVGLTNHIKSWTSPETRLRNLDAMRGTIEDYYEHCRALRAPGTLRGFLTFFASDKHQSSENAGSDVVNVMTYHKAKGLEWPVVVMEALDKDVRFAAFGTAVEQDGELDLKQPLKDRWIRFWPSPFPYKASPLDAAGQTSQVAIDAELRERNNTSRLMYVGMTRAKETTILTAKSNQPQLLNLLGVPSLISWSGEVEDGLLNIAGSSPLPVRITSFDVQETRTDQTVKVAHFTDPARVQPLPVYPPARLTASSESSSEYDAKVLLATELGPRLAERGSEEWGAVGSAVHAYLGTQYSTLTSVDQLRLAETIIERWKIGHVVSPELLIESGARLETYLTTAYPGWTYYREAAIGWRTENRVMQGWIDLLLEGPEGCVLIDHKTYPGNDPEGHIRDKYLGQMAAYRDALAAAGMPVIRTLMHLPALGQIYEVAPVSEATQPTTDG